MPYLTIENFKYGLDTRRSELTSQAGVLVKCENAHVNQGGEVTKRKAFVKKTGFIILDTNGDQGLFGLETTSGGLVVFGSALPFGSARNVTTQGPKLVADVPVTASYVQVQHPALWQAHGVSYNRLKHRLTSIVFTRPFNGVPFVCAKFADTHRVFYYDYTSTTSDGTAIAYYIASMVEESQNGVVFNPLVDDSNLANELSRQINGLSGWRGIFNTGINGRGNIYSPVGLSFAPVVDYVTTTANRIGLVSLESAIPIVPNTPSVTSFELTSIGTPEFITISAFSDSTGTTAINLLDTLSIGGLTAIAAAAKVVDRINAFTSAHGYSAVAKGTDGVLAIFAPPSFGAVTFNLTVTITSGTQGAGGAFGKPLAVSISTKSLDVTITNAQSTIITQTVTAYAQAGTSPNYNFQWQNVENPSEIQITSAATADTTFKIQLPKNTQVIGTFKCVVTCGTTQLATPVITVKLTRGKVSVT